MKKRKFIKLLILWCVFTTTGGSMAMNFYGHEVTSDDSSAIYELENGRFLASITNANGGNDLNYEFTSRARQMISAINRLGERDLRELGLNRSDINNISQKIEDAKVKIVDISLFVDGDSEEKTAINYPDMNPPEIHVNRELFLQALESASRTNGIILHEYLGVAGMAERDSRYQLSFKILNYLENLYGGLSLNLSPVDLEESRFFRRYLETHRGVTNKYDLEIRLAELKFERHVFNRESERWWQGYNDVLRDKKVKEYWDVYFRGQEDVKYFLSEASINTDSYGKCNLIKQFVEDYDGFSEAEDFAPIIHSAYLRGVKSLYPYCFIENFPKVLEELDQNVRELRDSLVRYRMEVSRSQLSEVDLIDLSEEIKKQVLSIFLCKFLPTLKPR